MHRSQVKPSKSALDKMLGEASWLLSHAEALADYGRKEQLARCLARANKEIRRVTQKAARKQAVAVG